SRLSLKVLVRSARPVLILVAFTAIVHLFFTGGDALFKLGFLTITSQGANLAVRMGLRLIFLVLFANLLTLTTSPMELADGLERLLSPLKPLGFPAHELAMMMTIALRFIPTLLNETDRIMKAQLARGAELDQGGIIKRLRAFIPVLVPLFVIVFKRADELAVAMEARGYRGGVGRSRMYPLCWSLSDTLALIFVVIVTLVFIYVDRWA
ncbi:MAG: Cobalt transport protein, partial [Synergistales bacterium 54_24]